MAVGVYGVEAAVVAAAALGRLPFPRARPEPRVLPKEFSALGAGVVAVASAEAPDDSLEDMSMLLVESACHNDGAYFHASRSSVISLDGGNSLLTFPKRPERAT